MIWYVLVGLAGLGLGALGGLLAAPWAMARLAEPELLAVAERIGRLRGVAAPEPVETPR